MKIWGITIWFLGGIPNFKGPNKAFKVNIDVSSFGNSAEEIDLTWPLRNVCTFKTGFQCVICLFAIGMHLLSGTISFSHSLLTGSVNNFFIGNIMNVEMVTHSHTLFVEYLFTLLINKKIKYILTWHGPWNLLTW